MFAELTVSTEVRNVSDHGVEGVLKAEIGPYPAEPTRPFSGTITNLAAAAAPVVDVAGTSGPSSGSAAKNPVPGPIGHRTCERRVCLPVGTLRSTGVRNKCFGSTGARFHSPGPGWRRAMSLLPC